MYTFVGVEKLNIGGWMTSTTNQHINIPKEKRMATCAICKKNLNVPVWGAAVCAECNLAGEKLPRLPIMLKTFLEEHGIDKSTRRIYIP